MQDVSQVGRELRGRISPGKLFAQLTLSEEFASVLPVLVFISFTKKKKDVVEDSFSVQILRLARVLLTLFVEQSGK